MIGKIAVTAAKSFMYHIEAGLAYQRRIPAQIRA